MITPEFRFAPVGGMRYYSLRLGSPSFVIPLARS
jgi:hypothetical protein